MAEAWKHRKAHMRPLHRAFVRTARRHPFRLAMADAASPKVSFASALMRTIFLARRLRKVWAGQQMVGLLLPPSVPGALVNFAALLMGKVPVNLNYTVSEATLASCIRQCGIKTVLTSRAFLDKVKLKVPGQTVLPGGGGGQAGRRREALRAAQRVAAAGGPAGALARAREESRAGRPGDGHLLQRQHGRPERRACSATTTSARTSSSSNRSSA